MGVFELNLMKEIQNKALSVGMLLAFGLVLYYRYPKISSGLNKIFKRKSKKKDKKSVSSDEEIIFLIQGYMLAFEDKNYTAKEVIKKIKNVVN